MNDELKTKIANELIAQIEAAGYVVVKRQPVQQPQMGYLQSAVQGDNRSYADRADGATSFDGELQFEIDRAKEGL